MRVAGPAISGSVSGKNFGKTFRGDRFRVVIVEFGGDVAGQLQMLLLVVPHRHMGGLVEQDVGGHQRGIGQKPERDVLGIFPRLVLELGHAVHPADPRDAVEDPRQFGVLDDLALVENDMGFGVDPRRDERRGDLAGGAAQFVGVLPDGDRVHVDDAIDALMGLLQRHETADGAEIVAQVQVARGLDAGKDAIFDGHDFSL